MYKAYQISVHGDKKEALSVKRYTSFLCSSPLVFEAAPAGEIGFEGYGSFHQKYYMSSQVNPEKRTLIATAFLDILPNCISSVYFVYAPQFHALSLGTYSALREIYQTMLLSKNHPQLRYYYMGYYIHTCPKMRYKAAYGPFELLCDQTQRWVDGKICIKALDLKKHLSFGDISGGAGEVQTLRKRSEEEEEGEKTDDEIVVRNLKLRLKGVTVPVSVRIFAYSFTHNFGLRSLTRVLDFGLPVGDERVRTYQGRAGNVCAAGWTGSCGACGFSVLMLMRRWCL